VLHPGVGPEQLQQQKRFHPALPNALNPQTLPRCPRYSVPEQLRSVAKLLQYPEVRHVLPAHGRPMRLRDAAHWQAAVHELLKRHGVAGAATSAAAPALFEAPAVAQLIPHLRDKVRDIIMQF
jgi:hypothetical protein